MPLDQTIPINAEIFNRLRTFFTAGKISEGPVDIDLNSLEQIHIQRSKREIRLSHPAKVKASSNGFTVRNLLESIEYDSGSFIEKFLGKSEVAGWSVDFSNVTLLKYSKGEQKLTFESRPVVSGRIVKTTLSSVSYNSAQDHLYIEVDSSPIDLILVSK